MLLCCQGPGGAAQGAGHRERRHQGPHQDPAVPGEPHGWVRQWFLVSTNIFPELEKNLKEVWSFTIKGKEEGPSFWFEAALEGSFSVIVKLKTSCRFVCSSSI